MSIFNVIPLGDHCAISIILKEIGVRNQSYPFDWITSRNQLGDTNLIYNYTLIKALLENHDVKSIVNNFIGDAFEDNNNKENTTSNIWFPHDSENVTDIFTKYERRFERLYNDIKTKKNLFIMLTRSYYIPQEIIDQYIETLIVHNAENKILFISGLNHEYLSESKYKKNVIFKYIYYDTSQFYDYDYSDFRPKIKEYLKDLFTIDT